METGRRGPLAVECTRGPAVESRHLVDAAVVDPSGRLVQGWGETDSVVYPRSAIKSVQVLPLIETGAAERLAVTDEEIAIACSSHNGQAAHVAVVRAWLAARRARRGRPRMRPPTCPTTRPRPTRASAPANLWARRSTTCARASTTAFLVTARALGEPTRRLHRARPPRAAAGVCRHRRALRPRSRAGALGHRRVQHPDHRPAALRVSRGLRRGSPIPAASRTRGRPRSHGCAARSPAIPSWWPGDGRACTRIMETAGRARSRQVRRGRRVLRGAPGERPWPRAQGAGRRDARRQCRRRGHARPSRRPRRPRPRGFGRLARKSAAQLGGPPRRRPSAPRRTRNREGRGDVMLRLSDFAGRVLREDDLDDLGRPTGAVIEEAIDEGRTEEAKTLARNLIHEWKGPCTTSTATGSWDMLTKIGAQVRRGRGLRHAARDPGDLDDEADLEGLPQDERRAPGHAHHRDDARPPLRPAAGGRRRGAGGREPLHHRHGSLRQRRAHAARRPDGRHPFASRPALQFRLDAGGALVELGPQGRALLLRPLRAQRDPPHRVGRRAALGSRTSIPITPSPAAGTSTRSPS